MGATGDVGYGDLSPHLSLDIRMGCGARTDREVAHYRVKMLMNIFSHESHGWTRNISTNDDDNDEL